MKSQIHLSMHLLTSAVTVITLGFLPFSKPRSGSKVGLESCFGVSAGPS